MKHQKRDKKNSNVHTNENNDPKTSSGLHRKFKKCSDLFDRLIESEMKNLE